MNDDKRHLRQVKRELKRAGTRRVRRGLKTVLRVAPEYAHETEVDYGRYRTRDLHVDRLPDERPT